MPTIENTAWRSGWARIAALTAHARGDGVLAIIDVVLAGAAFVAMLLLRYDGSVPNATWEDLGTFLPVVMVAFVISNWAWGLYGQLWRHASFYEARRLALSGVTMTLLTFMFQLSPRHVPLSVAVTGPVFATLLMGLVRFQSRLFSFRRTEVIDGLRVVVIGAGDAGASLVADMVRSPRAGFRPVAVLDDAPHLRRRSFMGVEVCGGIDDLPDVVERTGAHLAVFAMTNAPQDVVRRAVANAELANVALKIVPGISSAMRGGVSLRDLRDVQIEDLLGRKQITTDLERVAAMIRGRSVLITGAGGSIGSEIARQVASFGPSRLLLVDHDETHLYDIATELDGVGEQVLADIRNFQRVRKVFADAQPEVVFHAAAHKHVPLLEGHPAEAVATNVLGTANVLAAAAEVGVERLVFISTDKAVYPSSVMGASKRLGEQLVISRTPVGASYCAVRFGNVLGSRGSVVPTFVRQIDAGGPVTVTDRRMTRFFMSITEAVQLVLQAGALAEPRHNGEGGSVFMLDMGEPVTIYDLAERMIRLSGRQPGTDIQIKVTGVRPGEKLAEELRALDEAASPTTHPSISRITPIPIQPVVLERGLLELEVHVADLDDTKCGRVLRNLATIERTQLGRAS